MLRACDVCFRVVMGLAKFPWLARAFQIWRLEIAWLMSLLAAGMLQEVPGAVSYPPCFPMAAIPVWASWNVPNISNECKNTSAKRAGTWSHRMSGTGVLQHCAFGLLCSYAEYVSVPAHKAIKIPDGMSAEMATAGANLLETKKHNNRDLAVCFIYMELSDLHLSKNVLTPWSSPAATIPKNSCVGWSLLLLWQAWSKAWQLLRLAPSPTPSRQETLYLCTLLRGEPVNCWRRCEEARWEQECVFELRRERAKPGRERAGLCYGCINVRWSWSWWHCVGTDPDTW